MKLKIKRIIKKLVLLKEIIIPHIKSHINRLISRTESKIGKNTFFKQEVIFWGKGSVKIGKNCRLGFKYGGGYKGRLTELQSRAKEAEIIIKDGVSTNNGLFICAIEKIIIGEDTLIGNNVTIMDHNAHGIKPKERRTSCGSSERIIIGKNVWIGNNVTILKGTTIGDNSIIGVGSIVKGEFPENVIISGNPAKIIKKIES